jgi:hypothetical protein
MVEEKDIDRFPGDLANHTQSLRMLLAITLCVGVPSLGPEDTLLTGVKWQSCMAERHQGDDTERLSSIEAKSQIVSQQIDRLQEYVGTFGRGVLAQLTSWCD